MPFIVIGLTGFLFRAYFAAEPLWIDELHSAWVVDAQFSDVPQRAAAGNQTPFYFLVLYAVCQVAGLTVESLRSLSMAASCVSILAGGYFVWRWTNRAAAAALAAIFLAGDYWMIFYGAEARCYGLLQLLCIAQTHYLAAALDFRPAGSDSDSNPASGPVIWPLATTTALLVATHLTGIWLIASQLLFVIAYRPKQLKQILLSLAIGLLALVFCVPVLSQVLTNRSDWELVVDPLKLVTDLLPTLVPCMIAPLLMLANKKIFLDLQEPHKNHSLLWFVGCSAAGPVLIAGSLTIAGVLPLASVRYVAAGLVLMPLFAGIGWSMLESYGEKFALLFMVVAAVWMHPLLQPIANNQPVNLRSENWQSVAERVSTNTIGRKPLIFLFANLVEDHRLLENRDEEQFQKYLQFPLTGIYRLPPDATIIPMPTLATNRWRQEHLELLLQNGGAQIVARTNPTTLRAILDELQQLPLDPKLSWDIQTETQAGNLVQIVNVRLQENQ